MDVAPHSAKAWVKDVSMVCLERLKRCLPGNGKWNEPVEEGIKINHAGAQRRSSGREIKLEGLEVVKVKSVFDTTAVNPSFDNDQTTVLEADTIIITIGQMSNLAFLKDSSVKVDERGRLAWNPETQMSMLKKCLFQVRL